MIRLALRGELGAIKKVYRIARRFMRDNGNPTQWKGSYPSGKILKNDINSGNLYVYTENDIIHGVFAFIIGEEKTYARIDNGSWGDHPEPYGTIHRVASDGAVGGIFGKCVDFCKGKIGCIRVDTHENNSVMRHLIEKHGFQERGIIYVYDGSPRIAYQYLATDIPFSGD